jgi:hypothetical protein
MRFLTGTASLRWAAFAGAFVCLAVIFGLAEAYFSNNAGLRSGYDSDLVQPFMVTRDFVSDPSSLKAWYLSPANFAFPDTVISGLLVLLKLPMAFLPTIYSGLLSAALVCASAFLVREAVGAPLAVVAPVHTAVWLVLIAWSNLAIASLGGIVLSAIPLAFDHSGTLVVGLVMIALAVRVIANEPADRALAIRVLLSTLAVVAVFSDIFSFAWFVLPIAAIWAARRDHVSVRQAALFLLSGLIGAALDKLTMRFVAYGAPDYGIALRTWSHGIFLAPFQGDWLMLLVDLGAVGLFAHAAILARQRSGGQFATAIYLLAAVQFMSLLTPIVIGRMPDNWAFRYAMPAFFVPIVWASAVSMMAMSRNFRRGLAGVAGLLTLACVAVFFTPAIAAAKAKAAPSPLAQCLMRLGLKEGIADYWNTKLLIFDSDYRLGLIQVDRDGHLYRWNINSRWFAHTLDGSPAQPTFILPQNLDEDALVAQFGQPAAITYCANSVVWLYDSPMSLPTG